MKSKIPAQIYLLNKGTNDGRWVCNINAITVEHLKDQGIDESQMRFEEDPAEEDKWIRKILEWSEDLNVEVVQWALMYIRNNPDLTPAQAMKCGYEEWVK